MTFNCTDAGKYSVAFISKWRIPGEPFQQVLAKKNPTQIII